MTSTSIIWLGIFLILLGTILVVLPTLGRYVQLERLPSWLIYVHRVGNFYFVTSPILILISALALVLFLLSR